jgi:hypothetical protein
VKDLEAVKENNFPAMETKTKAEEDVVLVKGKGHANTSQGQ